MNHRHQPTLRPGKFHIVRLRLAAETSIAGLSMIALAAAWLALSSGPGISGYLLVPDGPVSAAEAALSHRGDGSAPTGSLPVGGKRVRLAAPVEFSPPPPRSGRLPDGAAAWFIPIPALWLPMAAQRRKRYSKQERRGGFFCLAFPVRAGPDRI